jgi:hypothetical protein
MNCRMGSDLELHRRSTNRWLDSNELVASARQRVSLSVHELQSLRTRRSNLPPHTRLQMPNARRQDLWKQYVELDEWAMHYDVSAIPSAPTGTKTTTLCSPRSVYWRAPADAQKLAELVASGRSVRWNSP